MILTCPNCDTRYSVDPASLMPDGRAVRCANCGHTWTERPPGDMPKTVEEPEAELEAEPEAEPEPEAEVEEPEDDFDVPSIEDVTVQATAKLARARTSTRRINTGAIIGWSSIAAVLAMLVGSGWFFRAAVMEVWPPSTQLYQLMGLASAPLYAIALMDVTPSQVIEGEVPVIVVTGAITNITNELQAVPRMRGALLDAQSQEIFSWTFDPPTPELAAGEIRDFNTRVPNPPLEARGVLVTFEDDG